MKLLIINECAAAAALPAAAGDDVGIKIYFQLDIFFGSSLNVCTLQIVNI